MVSVSLIALILGNSHYCPSSPQHRRGCLALDTTLCSKSTRPLVTHPARIILYLISVSNHVLDALL